MLRAKTLAAIFALFTLIHASPQNHQFSKNLILMDTFVHLEIRGRLDNKAASGAFAKVTERMRELEKKFDYYADDSELTKINKLNVGEKFRVSPDMLRVLKASLEMYQKTGGAFDVALGKRGWVLDEDDKAVILSNDNVKIDLGGIAKGFIVDEAVKILKKQGVRTALINAGGDMYCMGMGQTEGWKIGIRDPRTRGDVIGSFSVSDKGVATSGDYERPSHIIDPKNSAPMRSALKSSTVVAVDCMTADALATALFVLDTSEGLKLIEKTDNAECVIVDEDGRVHKSSGFGQISLTKSAVYYIVA
ncbi:MAG: FAD:protein FMN transferase [Candidatus Omnitrophica bacterium]|nr:FAD:protein FMN transferase [Candidatus Omnitrophota bacterium]